MRRLFARTQLGALALVCALALGACGDDSTDLTVVDDISMCSYVFYVDYFPEPSPHDPVTMQRWADGLASVASHLRPDIKTHGQLPSKDIVADVLALRKDATAFKAAVHSAGNDPGKLDAAFTAFATNDFTKVTSDLYNWNIDNCSS